MDKYLIRKPCIQDSSPVQYSSLSFKRILVDFNLENLPLDPGLREKALVNLLLITLYHIFLESPVDLDQNGM